MKTIHETRPDALLWVRPRRFKHQYELHAGVDVVAALQWNTRWGSLATAETADGVWIFRVEGIMRRRVLVRSESHGTQVATFQSTWTPGGTLQCRDGRSFVWSLMSVWRSEWGWRDSRGRLLVRTRGKGVTLSSRDLPSSDLSLLVLLAQHLRELQRLEMM